MVDNLITLDVRCPMLFGQSVDRRDERCLKDCAWLLTDSEGTQVCAIALIAGSQTNWSVRARFDDWIAGKDQ